jgi:hypothetical protein
LGFAEYLKEQGKRVGERDAGERAAFLKMRERDAGERKKIREKTCGGEGERKKSNFFFFKVKVRNIILMI